MDAIKKKGLLARIFGNSRPETIRSENFYYEQIADAVGAGGWTIDFIQKKSYFDKQLRLILATPRDYKPSLNDALRFYNQRDHERVIKEFEALQKGIPCAHEVEMISYTNESFWARCIGKPIFDKSNRVIGVRGIILNIDDTKKRELALQHSLTSMESSNNRIFKFANHISHDLKNQINNLELTSQLIDPSGIPEDQIELFNNYDEIAQSLSKTVKQLNEIVCIQSKAKKERELIDLVQVFEECKSTFQQLIQEEEGYVYADFSEVPKIHFNRNFFKNILCTLMENGLRNSKPGRKPEVKAYSLEGKSKFSIIIEDNGAGIEVSEDDEYVYHMVGSGKFKSQGQALNLFVIKNQIESMNASLSIESRPGYGTKFIIDL